MSFHLLLVDDQVALLESLSRRFERRGFRVSKAATLSEAHAVFESEKVDVCVCDMQLNDNETGVDLIVWLQASPKFSQTPVIILTGQDLDGVMVIEAKKKGAFSVFSKPTDFGLLLDGVRNAAENVTL